MISANLQLLSFDVFGTLVSVRDGSYGAFRSILREAGAPSVDVKSFWECWEEHNIAHYREPYRSYKAICQMSLDEAFAHFGIPGRGSIQPYFDAFPHFPLYPDVIPTLEILKKSHRLAIVSNIDDDLLTATPLPGVFDLICTAERAGGYKPDGTLFRYFLTRAGGTTDTILHSGQSQLTDLVGGKPLGLTIAWINRRGVALDPSVPRPDYVFGDIASLIPLLRATLPATTSDASGGGSRHGSLRSPMAIMGRS
jgi:2-haloalkanoic acid dehalogenase type II